MKRTPSDVRDVLPLSAAAFHILVALSDGDLHGYAISKDVAELTGDTLVLGPGTLYRVIKQLVHDGWIAEVSAPAHDDDPRRRYYRLTAVGRRIASAEARRLADLVAVARARRLLPA